MKVKTIPAIIDIDWEPSLNCKQYAVSYKEDCIIALFSNIGWAEEFVEKIKNMKPFNGKEFNIVEVQEI